MVFSERKFQQGLGRYVFQLFRNKQLNVIVGCISNIHMAKTIHVNTFRLGKLPFSFSFTAPFCYKKMTTRIKGYYSWLIKLPIFFSFTAPFCYKSAVTRKDLNPVVSIIWD